VRAGRRGLGVLAAAGTAITFAALVPPADAAPAPGVVNPYSPAYGHAYRHGVVPTRAVHAKM
jgi:serine protease